MEERTSLTNDEKATFNLLVTVLTGAKDYSEIKDFHGLFADLEAIVSALALLIDPQMRLEQAYRELVVKYMDDGDSHAKAEAKARASEEYRKWKKLELTCKLADEQIKALKKFESSLAMEWQRS